MCRKCHVLVNTTEGNHSFGLLYACSISGIILNYIATLYLKFNMVIIMVLFRVSASFLLEWALGTMHVYMYDLLSLCTDLKFHCYVT